jgi:hypothetical protein
LIREESDGTLFESVTYCRDDLPVQNATPLWEATPEVPDNDGGYRLDSLVGKDIRGREILTFCYWDDKIQVDYRYPCKTFHSGNMYRLEYCPEPFNLKTSCVAGPDTGWSRSLKRTDTLYAMAVELWEMGKKAMQEEKEKETMHPNPSLVIGQKIRTRTIVDCKFWHEGHESNADYPLFVQYYLPGCDTREVTLHSLVLIARISPEISSAKYTGESVGARFRKPRKTKTLNLPYWMGWKERKLPGAKSPNSDSQLVRLR